MTTDDSPIQQHTDDTTTETVSVTEAADLLGISPDAVRARIHRGTLYATKRDNLWRVHLSADGKPYRPTDRHTTDQAVSATDAIAPLTALLAETMRENAANAAAAALWQDRARHLEQQLRQLQAGEVVASPERAEDRAGVETYRSASNTRSASILERWKRWLKGE